MYASDVRGPARVVLLAVAACGLLASPMRVRAQDEGTGAPVPSHVGLLLMVSHVTVQPGPVDPSAAEIHRRLHDEFQFQSFRVLERHSMDLRLQEVGGVVLPTGKRVELRPIAVSPTGVLIAVDIPGTLQTDVRVPNRKQVVIGVERYQDGKLLLTLQPNY